VSKIAIITIHYGNFKNLDRTLHSINKQKFKPDLHLVIAKNISVERVKKYKLSFRKFIIDHKKDKCIWSAMNIGLMLTKKYHLIFLNSGDKFVSKLSLFLIKKYIKKYSTLCLSFNTINYFDGHTFRNKNNFFNKNFIPHPSFVRPDCRNKKVFLFNTKNAIDSDSKWIKNNINLFGIKKIYLDISKHFLGGISTNPSIASIVKLYLSSKKQGTKELIKYIIRKIIYSTSLYYRIIYFHKYYINKKF
jgi:hypothetical protein